MAYRTLISPEELFPHLGDDDWAVVDCRFNLAAPDEGAVLYREAHIPGAIYAHLERDLSAPVTGRNGRHPLPAPEPLARAFSRWGIGSDVQVVTYDADAGQIAARLWWSLRHLGHDDVAVLDGGLKAWEAAGLPVRGGEESCPPRVFRARVRESMCVGLEEMTRLVEERDGPLVDARDPQRYRGEIEPLDPVAGHIPGALNLFWQENTTSEGRFRSPEELRRRFRSRLGSAEPGAVVSYCGSGVTACHNLLALEHAGLPGARLYPGSWSEWCADPSRPIETGEPSANG